LDGRGVLPQRIGNLLDALIDGSVEDTELFKGKTQEADHHRSSEDRRDLPPSSQPLFM
jgi:hypothetical protein